MSRPALSVIIVTHNDRGHLEECLDSLIRADGAEGTEICVVDNDSTDGSPELVAEGYRNVHLIRMGENAGFAKANNAGFRECSGENILFLNPDTILPKNGLTGLLAALENPAVGAAGPLMYDRERRFQVSFGGRRTFWGEMVQKGLLNACQRRAIGRLRRPRDVTWISGACLLARRRVLEAVGGFDEDFFLYFEDIDLCYRIKGADWKLIVHPGVKIFHAGGASTGKQPLRSRYFYRQSQISFYRKHNGFLSRLLLKAYLALNFVFAFPRGMEVSRRRESRRDFLRLLRG
jgi:GT2 family glycosyltransferase